MKNAIRLALAGTTVLGAAVANAASPALPTSGTSDLWLFVTNTATSQTYARDTGVSVTSLLPSGSLVAHASLDTSISDTIDITADGTLSTFLSGVNPSNLAWGVEAVNQSAAKTKVPGNLIGITSNGGPPGNVANMTFQNILGWEAGYVQDAAYMANNGLTQNGSVVFNLSAGSTAANAWGFAVGNTAGSVDLYGQGPNSESPLGNTPVNLYGLTGDNSPSAAQSYILASVELTSSGELKNAGGSPPPVPLPAAIWLFGSGLLGLAGVGRRRSSAA